MLKTPTSFEPYVIKTLEMSPENEKSNLVNQINIMVKVKNIHIKSFEFIYFHNEILRKHIIIFIETKMFKHKNKKVKRPFIFQEQLFYSIILVVFSPFINKATDSR